MPKRLARRAATLVTTLTLAATTALTVGVTPAAGAADPNCTGYGVDALVDPDSAAYIRNRSTGTVVGSIQLCQRWDTWRSNWIIWAWVTLYYDMSPGQHANGRVSEDSQLYNTCSDYGGTGPIIGGTGDRTCASAGLWYDHPYQYRAEAYVYNSAGSIIAAGDTGWWD